MKTLLMIALLFLSVACQSNEKAAVATQVAPIEEEAGGMIAPENDMCICTKEFDPVCGADGQTYSNPCEAGCKKVKFTKGDCK